jgi:hypothetical protein
MRQRWLPVGLLTGALFLINVLGRLAARFWAKGNEDRQANIGLLAVALIGVAMIGAAIWWVRRYPSNRAWGDLLTATAVGGALCVLGGPLVMGHSPWASGAGTFFQQVWLFLGMALGGAGFGTLIVMTLGQDWKSQAWKRYTQQASAKPRRVVRR